MSDLQVFALPDLLDSKFGFPDSALCRNRKIPQVIGATLLYIKHVLCMNLMMICQHLKIKRSLSTFLTCSAPEFCIKFPNFETVFIQLLKSNKCLVSHNSNIFSQINGNSIVLMHRSNWHQPGLPTNLIWIIRRFNTILSPGDFSSFVIFDC